MINRKYVSYFNCVCGVRQGDPLSPLLFCIAKELLHRALSIASSHGLLVLINYCRGIHVHTHVLYDGDIMIFFKAS